MAKDDKIQFKNIALRDQLIEQLDQDRSLILEAYNELKRQVSDKNDYALHGLTMTKFLEILTKQTNQVLDLLKSEEKNQPGNVGELSDDQIEDLYKASQENQDSQNKKVK